MEGICVRRACVICIKAYDIENQGYDRKMCIECIINYDCIWMVFLLIVYYSTTDYLKKMKCDL